MEADNEPPKLLEKFGTIDPTLEENRRKKEQQKKQEENMKSVINGKLSQGHIMKGKIKFNPDEAKYSDVKSKLVNTVNDNIS